MASTVIIDAVDTQTQSSFVVHWISRYIPDIDKWRAFIPDTQHSPNQAAVNELLNQFFSNSAFPASQVNWDEHCMNVSNAMHQVMKAFQCDSKAVPPDQLQKLCDLLKYEAPALAVCACSWCCGHIHALTVDERKHPLRLVNSLLKPVNAKGFSLAFLDRCAMLLEVMERMTLSIEGKDNTWDSENPVTAGKPVSELTYIVMVFTIFDFQVLLSPSYIPEQVVDVLDSVMHTQNIPRSQLYLEFLRSSFVGILEAPEKSMELVLWTGFLFLKVPAVLLILESRLQVANQLQPTPAEHSTVLNAFQQLLQFIPLLDDADIKCSCNCYREVLQQYSKSLNSQVTQKIEHLISQRIEKSHRDISIESEDYEHPLNSYYIGVCELCNYLPIKLSVFFLIHRVSDQTVHAAADKEDVKRGSVRGELFHTSFLLLCHIGQVYGRKVIIDAVDTQTQSSFVVHWISRYIPDIDKWRAFIPDTQHSPNQAAVNELLNQFFSNSAFPASQVNWDEHCMNVSNAMHQVMKAFQCDSKAVPPDQLQKLCDLLKYEAPALAVCACSWCCGHIHALTVDERKHPLRLVNSLLKPVNAKGFSLAFLDRCAMLLEVMERMTLSIEGKDNTWDSENPVTAGKPVSEVFQLIRSYFHFGILFDLTR
ncbi:PREDICTED: mediator of RNA polymerase II transcription subunit 24-like [Acropora digitifera]|uniref:mediator of RNA polymerase II transcription subunit 24-like n=1 Tax=Acropora digitifera TaxID=70779 RepID=UPI00077AEEF8|nr:PREDICTED: mediator of RNA polymerase II transcription subunit 24-like [Acropora digitifera]